MRHALLALAALSIATTADAGVIYVKKGATGANNGTSWNEGLDGGRSNDMAWARQHEPVARYRSSNTGTWATVQHRD